MKYRKSLLVIGIIATTGAAVWYVQERSQQRMVGAEPDVFSVDRVETATVPVARTATVYKAPNCGCCNGYIAELKKQGYEVDVRPTEDMGSIKEQYGIEEDKQSCHTTVIWDYFVEGHVPLVAVEKLLSEKPDIDGIGLPGMPIGTPGMPGVKQAPYEIYQKSGSDFSQFMTL
jgi:hypothetical protein